jgi:hypothetical protein
MKANTKTLLTSKLSPRKNKYRNLNKGNNSKETIKNRTVRL